MATYTWRAANGAFDNANNWDPAIVPSAGDTVLFNAAVGTITGAGSVDTIAFSSAGWTVAGQLTANTVNVLDGSVSLNGGSAQLVVLAAFSAAGGAAFGITNSAVLSVTQGGTATFGAGSLSVTARAIGNFNGALRLGSGGTTSAVVDAAVLTVGSIFSLGATAGGTGYLTIQDGGQAVVNAARDDTANYLQLGAVAGANSNVRVDGSGSLLLLSQNSGGIGVAGSGELDVTNGATARFNSGNNALNPALVLGVQRFSSGGSVVSGSGSTLASGGSVIVGKAGAGSLTVTGGGIVTSVGLTGTQAALAVGAATFGTGTLSIQGAGSQFLASGAAVIGGDNRGSGLSAGGTGTVSITSGGLLQTNALTLQAGSSIVVDGESQENIAGDLTLLGSLISAGTLSVSGTVSGSGTLTIAGGFAGVGTLSAAKIAFTTANATLRVSALTGTSQVSGMQSGDKIDLAGSATLTGNTVTTSTGSLVLSGNGPYSLTSDGSGGTFVSVGIDTIGVFRFFDSNYGTHFFSSSSSEKNTIITTRPDLVYEGVGLESVDPAASDPNAAAVYRFFDTAYGTHFFTASASERDTVIANRPDLLYEGTGFVEHVVQQPGDVGVYRFFDTRFGTHFYTADPTERATIIATRSDLVDEGIGFYAPSS